MTEEKAPSSQTPLGSGSDISTHGGLARKSLSIAKRDVFLMASNLGTGVIVARILGPEALGVWVIFQLVLAYAEALGRPKFDQAAVYFIGSRKYDAGTVAFTLHAVALASAVLLLGMLALAFDAVYSVLFRDAPDVRALFGLVLLEIPLQFMYLNYAYLHISVEDIWSYNRMTVVRTLANSVLSVAALLFGLGLTGVVWATLLSTTIGVGCGALFFHRRVQLVPNWDQALIKDFASYSGGLYLSGAVGQLNNQLTNFLCALFLVPAQLAMFSIASARRDILAILPNAASTLLLPRVSSMSGGAEAARLTSTVARILFVVMVGIGMAAALLARPAVLILYGPQYLGVVDPFLLLLPGFVLYSTTVPYLQYFLGMGRPDLAVKIAIPPLVLQLLLAMWLVPRWGIHGAALAVVVPLFVGSIITLAAFLRLSAMGLRETIAVRRTDLVLLREAAKGELRRNWPRRRKIRSSVT